MNDAAPYIKSINKIKSKIDARYKFTVIIKLSSSRYRETGEIICGIWAESRKLAGRKK